MIIIYIAVVNHRCSCDIIRMAEAVKVIVRCRPMNARENGLGCKDAIFIDERLAQCSIKNLNDGRVPPKSFTFDGAYGVNSTTQQIYAEIGFPLVEVIDFLLDDLFHANLLYLETSGSVTKIKLSQKI